MTGLVVILLGVSGVGKSRLASEIGALRPDILRLSAGGLLRKHLRTTSEKLRTADRRDVQENQFALAEALADERRGQEDRLVLLEAHSFIDNDQELVDVPVEIIGSLKPSGIILISTTAERLARQREMDERERPKRTVHELRRHLDHSRDLARRYSALLGIPMIQIEDGKCKAALEFIDSLGRC
ncbi:AAA family ATPase [Novosphingobium rosa]|uniref:AAA family ATPase n=1 Tax=Novosphingobium rosa TaxID=76978 RepID=UPI000829EA5F|nr:AAA family ATPase [Novosphingobium rosa]